MLIQAVPFYLAPDDKLYLGESKGRENVFLCLGVPKCLTATQRVPSHPRNGLKSARKERDQPKQPWSHALRSTRRRCVICSSPKEQVRARETLAIRGQSSPKQEHPPAPFPSCLLPSNHREATCLEFAADVLYPILSVCFPQNYEHRQKPKVTLLHFSIPV